MERGEPGRPFAGVAMMRPRWRVVDAVPAGAVTPVELFFDLVFVFTLTQLSHALEAHLTLAEAGRVLLLFGVLWYMYSGYAWLTNHVPPRRASQKLLLFAGMVGFLIAAVGVPRAFEETGLLFGSGYLLVVCVHLLLFTQADVLAGVARLAPLNLGSAGLVLAAGFADGVLVYVLWLAALALMALTPYISPRRATGGVATSFRLSPAHFVERHGLLVIVALGESVIAIGAGVDIEHLTAATIGAMALALALPAAMLWTYFTDAPAAEHRMTAASTAARSLLAIRGYYFAHIPLLLGIIIAAAGLHSAVAHPAERPELPAAFALGGGVSLFLLGIAEFRRAMGIAGVGRRIGAAAGVLVTIPLGTVATSGMQLAGVLGVIVGMLVADSGATDPASAQAR